MLNWTTIVNSRDPKFLVKGTELARAVCGENSRFALYEVRAYEADGEPTMKFRVRDGETVTLDEVKHGARPKVVFETYDYDEAVAFVNQKETV